MFIQLPVLDKQGSETTALVNTDNILWISQDSNETGCIVYIGDASLKTPLTLEEAEKLIQGDCAYTVEVPKESLPWAV